MQFNTQYGPVRVESFEGYTDVRSTRGIEVRAGVSATNRTKIEVGLHDTGDIEVTVGSQPGAVPINFQQVRVDPLTGDQHTDRILVFLSESTAASLCEALLDSPHLDLNPR